ncbi:sigma factor-like helix-turn-helix DNA-binding protein [Megasphaera stantonii]|uniref:sigma factor-like helix-turn-helix DNA-binding protein n=1 Tax=Megasphaera stantonii TaxID=2144175 RepID=UPI003D18C9D3
MYHRRPIPSSYLQKKLHIVKERQFLHLRYHADLTYADIARCCGLSLSQTHKLTQAAMAKFCDIMHRYDIHPLNGEEA